MTHKKYGWHPPNEVFEPNFTPTQPIYSKMLNEGNIKDHDWFPNKG